MIYIFTRVPETVFRIYEYTTASALSDQDQFVLVLNILQAICNPLQGFLNFVFFAIGPRRKDDYALFCCYRSSDDPSPSCGSKLMIACCTDCSFWLPLQPSLKWSKVPGLIASDPLLPTSSVNLTTDQGTQYCLPFSDKGSPREELLEEVSSAERIDVD